MATSGKDKEHEESKRRSVGQMPRRYLILVGGKRGSGKNTLADFVTRHSLIRWTQHSFAGRLRSTLQKLARDGIRAEETVTHEQKARVFPTTTLWTTIGEAVLRLNEAFAWSGISVDRTAWVAALGRFYTACDCKEKLDLEEAEKDDYKLPVMSLSVGRYLQCLGTEIGRQTLGENLWVEVVFKEWAEAGCPPMIITDTRFDNEWKAGDRYGGLKILVQADKRLAAETKMEDGRSATHASECVIHPSKVDLVIPNDGTQEEFYQYIVEHHSWSFVLSSGLTVPAKKTVYLIGSRPDETVIEQVTKLGYRFIYPSSPTSTGTRDELEKRQRDMQALIMADFVWIQTPFSNVPAAEFVAASYLKKPLLYLNGSDPVSTSLFILT